MGGSTTECRFLSNEKDWPFLFGEKLKQSIDKNIWINNAGLDGHSTFGHSMLLREYLKEIQPKFIFYLVGINELERGDLEYTDYSIKKDHATSILDWLKKHSEIAVLFNNIKRSFKAYKIEALHGNLNIKERQHYPIDSMEIELEILRHQPFIAAFEQRLSVLTKQTRDYSMEPILITQPLMFGEGFDPFTNVNLETIESAYGNGKTYWKILESYNDVTRKIAGNQQIFLIDLAKELPKNSIYFYDAMHFTNEGNEMISKILSEKWLSHFQEE